MIKISKGKISVNGKPDVIAEEFMCICVWFFKSFIIPNNRYDKKKCMYQITRILEDAWESAKLTMEGDE